MTVDAHMLEATSAGAQVDGIAALVPSWIAGGLLGLAGLLLLVWGLIRRQHIVEAAAPDPAPASFVNDPLERARPWMDYSATGMLVVDSTYRIEYINPAACDMLARPLSKGAVLPHGLAHRLPERTIARTVQWSSTDGQAIQVQVSPVRRDTGLYRVLTLHDRTAMARTEATLRDTDRLLRAILQTSVAAVAVVNDQGVITYANQQAESILGLENKASGTWTYRHMGWTLTPIDADATTRTPLYDVLTSQKPIRGMRCAITWPNGTRKYLLLNAAPLPDEGGTSRAVFSVQDVTQRYQAERKLKEEQRFSEAAINSLPGIFYMVDAQGQPCRWNDALESVTGCSAQEMAHRSLADLVVEPEAPRVRKAVRSAIADHTGFRIEANLATDSDTGTPYVFTGAPLVIDDTRYLVGVGLDITAQREREAALHKAREQAERMNALKTSFLTNMSHEIRTPLTTMIGYARILVEEDDPPKRFPQHIVNGGQRLLRTLDDILIFSQLEAGTYALTPGLMSVAACVQDAIDETAPDAQITLIPSETDSETDALSPVRLDAQAVTHIATHLLRNAVAFTEPNDPITIRIVHQEGSTNLVVADTGTGMPEAYVPRATEPFTQASVGPARMHEGSGLGLAIVEGLAELMGGSVAIDTSAGEGTTVSVRMSHAKPEASATSR